MTGPGILDAYARVERFGAVGSTNDIVRGWLAGGTPEVCVAVADEQLAGRGRNGRAWTAPTGAGLLCSVGFRPTWLDPADAWRLAGIVALAMADAAEDTAGLGEGTIRLKWPNDLVIVRDGAGALLIGDVTAGEAMSRRAAPLALRKLAGILGESDGLGTTDPRVVIGIGINADWPATAFPVELAATMTSLHEISGGRPIAREALLEGFLGRLETRLAALRGGRFDVAGWTARQVTTGHLVTLSGLDGSRRSVRAMGVDAASGALVIEEVGPEGPPVERLVLAGEILSLRMAQAGSV
ncbi:MAG: biotin--[acetyl-CoA-carboxylase] ligase [Chloroflexi bacterium]|nr:biotin--[acetyl-CoA-carboxylase] ligase [Chloroflexota bacterium]